LASVSEKKLKLLYLMELFYRQTDREHTLTLPVILQKLAEHGISAERKSIYDDIETLRSFGLDIRMCKTKNFEYYLANPLLGSQELKFLVEALEKDGELPEEKKRKLCGKLSYLCSVHQAGILQGRIAQVQEKTKGSDKISAEAAVQTAFDKKRIVCFQYADLELAEGTSELREVLRKSGKIFQVVPLQRLGEESFLGAEITGDKVKQFYLNRIRNPELSTEAVESVFLKAFMDRQEALCLEVDREALCVLAACFGKLQSVESVGKGCFQVVLNTWIQPDVLRFLLSFGEGVKVISPKKTAEQLRERAKALAKLYKN